VANEPKILQERTSSLDVALQAVARITPTTQATAFYNSVVKAARMLREVDRPDARRVIVALSDGEDNRSIDNKQSDVLRELQLTNCLFYSINPNGSAFSKSYFSRRAQESMEEMSRQTGGASFVADRVEELAAFYDRIAEELRGQYLLGYYSRQPPGRDLSPHRHSSARRPGLQVKARSGYFPK